MRFLTLRVVVNGHFIYNLVKNKPVVIDMPTNPTRVVITDGFHITQPMELTFTVKPVRYYTVDCVVEDAQLLAGLILTLITYFMGLTSGIVFLRALSMVPIFYLLFVYYINRKQFIRVRPL